ncbi:APC family permease [Nodularia sphaerocarpa]|uniref:APC family permease n=1 Tax=Nodularia sphaerocarpa TaxID=137816 RepID=UPI001EFB5719|nr:amino acid permease [Nodularia sphaerocarpa]MDB9373202.1 amino acid permease [Nodularia sphaerocarpa CS-585]MDB9380608.1 amino acid permease [Nodularia sphaerocarpa CS-585A2]ULP73808.1 Serine/threonine exchanger SteT [Nodularia sphaerocarpa UHCC 0038]
MNVSSQENYNLVESGATNEAADPKSLLTLSDAVALIVGIVIGAGIFQTPALVAVQAGSDIAVLLLWFAGGLVSLVGALCYAELATAYPNVGGVYYYLKRSFGRGVAFLFAWARMTVIQTGSIVLLAFVFGDYASQIWRLGTFSSSIYAAGAIALLTALNILGLRQGKWTQNWLSLAKVLGLLLVVFLGLTTLPNSTVSTEPTSSGNWGLAMVFVLLSYGGWNEAAYISAEMQNKQRNILRSLLWSIGIITGIYLLINLAYLQGLGLSNMAASKAVAADLMRSIWGEPGALFISLLIAVSTLGAINATIFTGARTNYALAQDFSLFSFMGRWQKSHSTPIEAFLLQVAIALALVVLGTITRGGFETMVDYTAPVFWLFFLLSGISLFVLRIREPEISRPFRVPFYPLTPLAFCASCGYLLYSSLAYTGVGAVIGVLVVAAGIPLLFWNRRRQGRE